MSSIDETVAAAKIGDPSAFDTLFGRNIPRLIAFIRARAGGVVAARESATDLAQSVCREALEDLGEFEFRGEREFQNWLFQRATRKIHNRHRWHHRECRDADREAPPLTDAEAQGVFEAYADLYTPSRGVRAREELSRIENALEMLPEPQRVAIALTRVASLSYTEAAEQMDRTESAVRGLVMRGLARLATILDEDEPEAGA